MSRLAVLFACLLGLAAANDRVVVTMGTMQRALIAKIEALPSVQGPVQYTDFASLIRVQGDESSVTALLDVAHIHYEVEMEKPYELSQTPWNLDRIDQRNLPLDNSPFSPVNGSAGLGSGVHIYIVDSGMNINHEEFKHPDSNVNRASDDYVVSTADSGTACSLHANAVASVAGGKTLGVARKAFLHNIKVAQNSGPSSNPSLCNITLGSLLEGLLWVIANGTTPSIINLSLQGPPSVCLDLLVKKLFDDGNLVVDAAGNSGILDGACQRSPARSAYSLTVGHTDIVSNEDTRNPSSNFGACMDFFAPGTDVTVAVASSNTGTIVGSGSSFAAPLVAGAAAHIKSHLELRSLPSSFPDVVQDLRDRAVTNNVDGAGPTNYYFLHIGADASLARPSLMLLLTLMT